MKMGVFNSKAWKGMQEKTSIKIWEWKCVLKAHATIRKAKHVP